jgi:hypothetical protein
VSSSLLARPGAWDGKFAEVCLFPRADVVENDEAQPPGVELRQQQAQADLGLQQLDRTLPDDLAGAVADLQDKSTICSRLL